MASGTPPTRERQHRVLPVEEFTAGLPKHVVSASLLLADPRGRVLMLHQAQPYPGHPRWWQPPGGLADPGERPDGTALRELAEETGLVPARALRLLAVDHRGAAGGWPPVIDFCFDAGVLPTGTLVALSAEHDRAAWRTPAGWQPHLQPEQRAWFAAVSRSPGTAGVLYLHDGLEHSGTARPAARSGG
ncbi:NUDIX hydrolase [Kitasatospora herbaricolor]|uniref:NUDIX hydrolase n=1 Tax=Kitasatospora herbaricolor TaxID=68217 RepID=A0ABZ1WH22_9ACTN|nr:NUDIX hydrolase [Kitasatospora herbaricolor]